MQKIIGPAGYFRDPTNLNDYVAYSTFLPYLNNEKPEYYIPSSTVRFSSLNKALFVLFKADSMLYPKETAWFWELQQDYTTLKPVDETEFYY